ncbi:RasGEF domain containing protein [Histomonas meleagridis]|uniref:RasGEF domain containing protein n=1 Tax=Histomonas meleagridis TaxID=135588 RepID=UPI003559B821|nr:RasGEF domain containing protein [Histomonas meleagridis]KAH0805882.1 RasGEF domain containing protein [Histomonas meleagridis]
MEQTEVPKHPHKKRPPLPPSGHHNAHQPNLPKTQFSGTAGIPQLNFSQAPSPLTGALPKTQFSGQLGIPTSLQVPTNNPLLSKPFSPFPPRTQSTHTPLGPLKKNDSPQNGSNFFTLMSLPQNSVMSLNPFTSKNDIKQPTTHRKKRSRRKVRRVDAKTTDFSKTQKPHVSMPHSSLIMSLNPFNNERYDADDEKDSPLGISIINPNVNPAVIFYNILDIQGEVHDELERLNTAVFMEKSEYIGDSTAPQAASFNQLMLFLTNPESANIEFQKMFLMTFSSFATPAKLLGALLTRYYVDINNPDSNIKTESQRKQVRARVVRILSSWVKMSPSQFTDDMIHAVEEFVKVLEQDPNCKMQVAILSASLDILKGKQTFRTVRKSSLVTPQPILTDEPPQTILDVDPVELARQASLYHNDIFCRIGSLELLTAIWGTKKGGGSHNVDELTQHFDMFSRYVQLTVIQGEDAKARAKVFKHWVDTAIAFREMNNFHGVFTVMCALTHRSVQRMKETIKASLKLLNRSTKKIYDNLVELCMFQNDFHNYREELKSAKEPCVPFIGSLQRDLIYVQNSYPNKIEGLTNVQKCQACVSLLKLVESFQNSRYVFQEVEDIRKLITTFPELPDTTEMMKLSMEKEAKKKN